MYSEIRVFVSLLGCFKPEYGYNLNRWLPALPVLNFKEDEAKISHYDPKTDTMTTILVASLAQAMDNIAKRKYDQSWHSALENEEQRSLLATLEVAASDGLSPFTTIIKPFDPHVVIMGQTPLGEFTVNRLNPNPKGIRPFDRPLIIRCSLFYPKKVSSYTGSSPNNAGYDLDVYKSLRVIDQLLFDHRFQPAVAERDSVAVQTAVNELNNCPPFSFRPIYWLS